eukprot:TRINITY_DN16331_c0_g1_i3.p1 TRINITY_DN16331_c0_g1~~TRINITY_DN16331_c0_g1_i3.p1  ORF type:complete len:513 (-),score=79.69 TRINITY_DN16331_c0_g1_i3:95-1411(-)
MTNVTCGGRSMGYRAAVAIVNHIATSEWIGSDKTATAERFASAIYKDWGVANVDSTFGEDCRNGLLLFVSTSDRMFYLKTAKQTREVLTDDQAQQVLDNMKPSLKEQKYGDAVLGAMMDCHDILNGKTLNKSDKTSAWWVWIVVAFVACFCCFCGGFVCQVVGCLLWVILYPIAYSLDCCTSCCTNCCSRRRFVDGSSASDTGSDSGSDSEAGKAWQDLKRVQEELERNEFDQTICAICLESLEEQPQQVQACGHRFHTACIHKWFLLEHQRCPLCRINLVNGRYTVTQQSVPTVDGVEADQQHRAGFFLSRLQQQHADVFGTGGIFSRDDRGYYGYRHRSSGCCGNRYYSQPVYYNDPYPGYYYWTLGHYDYHDSNTGSWTDALNARYDTLWTGAAAYQARMFEGGGGSGGGGGGGGDFSFGGGGDLSGGGGAGGGW